MIKFDFETYAKHFLDQEECNHLLSQKEEYIEKLNACSMVGWMNDIDKSIVEKIKKTADIVRTNYDCLVVVGIGGSFLGSYAFHQMFKKYFPLY